MNLSKLETLLQLNGLYLAIYHLLHDLLQADCESTLWVADGSHVSQHHTVRVKQTEQQVTLITTIPNLNAESLQVEVTPEVVLLRGSYQHATDWLQSAQTLPSLYFDLEFYGGGFQSLIPLPMQVQPESVIAELEGETLTLVMKRAWRSRQQVAVKILRSDQVEPENETFWFSQYGF